MDAAEILHTLADQGFSVAVDGERLTVAPVSRLTDDLRAEIREHRAEVVALLTAAGNAYLDAIGETDPAARAEWLSSMRRPTGFSAGLASILKAAGGGEPEPEPEGVTCCTCHHYQRNRLNPAGGLGRCLVDAPASGGPGSLWPYPDAFIRCAEWRGGG
ncbi:hypothetical protein [Marichromatium bheemlicum]|uniref:TubC N-terminal docking domain-containing protein n=1 Tax=Marichromatium bheemlicum TaxID=365339 RepID=A0ABX1IDE3_9GAMM|nr:hypothetical protein [Marichromatium bheemlicum]